MPAVDPPTGGTLGEALVHSLLAGGVGTGAGALPVLFVPRIGARLESALAGFSAGVMLAAAFFALLLPALASYAPADGPLAIWPVMLGVLLGGLTIDFVHRHSPHAHFVKGPEGAERSRLARVWLFTIALSLHNLPEGLAVGVGVATGDAELSLPVTISIGVQNMPEGLIVAIAFLAAGYPRSTALLVTLLTGLVEPIGAVIGFLALQVATSAMPAALAFAAGAMVYVVSHEIIPESHREGRSAIATFGVLVGVLAMLWIDAWLG
ncbi:MAG: ZIP family metal transporter [Planctomycetes bacterium]|nr:ZIP family metal transporter [Planctomycetota bacterium]